MMSKDILSENDAGQPEQPPKGDNVEVVKILVLAIISFVLGFGLVIFFLSPRDTVSDDDIAVPEVAADDTPAEATPPPDTEGKEEPQGAGYAPTADEGNPLIAGLSDGENTPAAAADGAEAPEEVPPGKTPEGIAIDGDAFYLKCWSKDGQETAGSDCDHLTVLEKRFSTRLYIVDKCKQAHAGAGTRGKLSIGMEVDFADNSISFWNGASSTLENAAKVGTCLRGELKGLPIHSVKHKFNRYRLFFTVLFGEAGTQTASEAPPAPAASSAPVEKTPKGRMVDVVMDRVRVRKSPGNGDIIGKISSGNQVQLLDQKGEWCRVLTPNQNEGWMTCEALKK